MHNKVNSDLMFYSRLFSTCFDLQCRSSTQRRRVASWIVWAKTSTFSIRTCQTFSKFGFFTCWLWPRLSLSLRTRYIFSWFRFRPFLHFTISFSGKAFLTKELLFCFTLKDYKDFASPNRVVCTYVEICKFRTFLIVCKSDQ
jgi:hypothetical protein